MQNGKSSKIYKYLGFLQTEYNMNFQYQIFTEYKGFSGPIITYSFYNNWGCITFHNIEQKGEWGWFTSKKFSTEQYELLENQINQRDYLKKSYFFLSAALKNLRQSIKNEIVKKNTVFGIKINKK